MYINLIYVYCHINGFLTLTAHRTPSLTTSIFYKENLGSFAPPLNQKSLNSLLPVVKVDMQSLLEEVIVEWGTGAMYSASVSNKISAVRADHRTI